MRGVEGDCIYGGGRGDGVGRVQVRFLFWVSVISRGEVQGSSCSIWISGNQVRVLSFFEVFVLYVSVVRILLLGYKVCIFKSVVGVLLLQRGFYFQFGGFLYRVAQFGDGWMEYFYFI